MGKSPLRALGVVSFGAHLPGLTRSLLLNGRSHRPLERG